MRSAIISVSDKTDVEQVANYLISEGYQIFSTGGTFRYLQENTTDPSKIVSVSSLTEFPEILGGRVKTLHPKIYGGLLARRSDDSHLVELEQHQIPLIDVVVVNLYPFYKAVDGEMEFNEAAELIDIGGVSLLRAAAKNFQDVLVISDPADYQNVIAPTDSWTVEFRRVMAIKAFQHTSEYDTMIYQYLMGNNTVVSRNYHKGIPLKYGCNPHQGNAAVWSIGKNDLPFRVINGTPGYINILDAINSWQLVRDLSTVLELPAAASFKHTSPAGAAVAVPLSDLLKKVYMCEGKELTPLATAYVRARNADPMSSFGDFIALSHEVDEATARLIKIEVSDGIIAPGFSPEALEILRKKKKGKYIILHANPEYTHSGVEYREMYGIALSQHSNDAVTDLSYLDNLVCGAEFTESQKRDLIVANVALKYSQSNNVAFAYDGQIIGLAAGQQSRVDCVKLARRKAETWFLRQEPHIVEMLDSMTEKGVKRQNRVNRIVDWIERFKEDYTDERGCIAKLFRAGIHVCLASDAFFPFSDSIKIASDICTTAILQPGGSIADESVIEACNEHGISMAFSGVRLFTH